MLRSVSISIAVIFVVLGLFVLLENKVARSFQKCVGETAAEQSGNSPNNKGLVIGEFIGIQSVCTIRVLDAHNGFFSSVATLIIAAFTGTLWRATILQARLTRQAIDLAADESKRAHRAKLAIRRIHSPDFRTGRVTSVKIDLVNQGIRAAVIAAVGSDIFLRPKSPLEPRSFDANFILTKDTTPLLPGGMFAAMAEGTKPLTVEDVKMILDGTVDLILIVNLQYIDDAGPQVASFFRIFDHKFGCYRRAETYAESQEWEYTD